MGTSHRPSEERRQQILEAAGYLLNRKGYYGTKIDDIVKKSKLSKGSIYRFYRNKEEVFLDLFDFLVSKFEVEVESLTHLRDDPKQLLENIVAIFTDHLCEQRNIFLGDVTFWSLASREAKFAIKVENLYKRWTNRFTWIFQEGILKQEFRNSDPHIAAMGIVALFDGFILRCVATRGDHQNMAMEAQKVLQAYIACLSQ